MKRIIGLLLTLALVLICALALADVSVNETNFPDEAFRNVVKEFDTDGDGKLSNAEIAAVTSISCSERLIFSLKGIEYFTALEELSCDNNWLTSLDVSKNTALKMLNCNGNQLTSLDVSKNTALERIECFYNQLTGLNVSNNTALTLLECSNNQLTSLDVSKNTALTWLHCHDNQLTSLNVSNNTTLKSLNCSSNQIRSLDVSKNMALHRLRCEDIQLTSLDVSKNTALEELACDSNQLTSLDVSKNTELGALMCDHNQLTDIRLGTMPNLKRLEVQGNSNLATLDISGCTELKKIVKGSGKTLTISGSEYFGWRDDSEARWPDVYLFTDKALKVKTGDSGLTLSSVKFSKTQATVKQDVTITAVTSTNAVKLAMYSGSKAIKTWTTGYTDQDEKRTWKVTYAFTGTGSKTMSFKAIDANGSATAAKTASITITKAPTLTSVAFAKAKATVKQNVTITAVTSTNTTKLAMYSGSKAIKSWTSGYTDKDGKRTWKVTYAFTGTGSKTMSFKAMDATSYATPAKPAAITVTKAPTLSSVKFSKTQATVKQNVTITAVTSTNTTKLAMYSGSKAIKSWTSGYTDKDGKRTWKVTYAFTGTGSKTMSFKAIDANSYATAAKTATITITKAPTLSSVKFSKTQATVKQNVTITAVTSTNTTKLVMYSGSKAIKSWTSGYTDKDGKRTWKVTYAFSGAGTRTMSFKAIDANGFATAAKDATIEITK